MGLEPWTAFTVDELCEFRRGLTWSKEQERDAPGNGRVPVLRIPNVQQKLLLDELLYLEEVPPDELTRRRATNGWCLMVGSNGNPRRVGNSVYVDVEGDFVFASFLVGVAPRDSSRLHPRFLHRLLQSSRVQGVISEHVQGSTGLKNINLTALRAVQVSVPPLPEQQKIAAILSSVDDVIEKTQAVIDQLQVVKKAMMQELLTRGLPGRHTRFKMTEVGEVPADWAVARVGDIAYVQTGMAKGKQVASTSTVDIPYLRVANVQDGYVDLAEMKTLTVEPAAVERYGLRQGDVLFTEGGDADKLGRGCVWRGEITPCLHQNHVFAVRPEPERLSPDFLAYFAASPAGKAYFLDCAKQTTNLASINSSQLKAMPVPVPDLAEQKKIVDAVASADVLLAAERRALVSVRDLKSALSAVLLTGEVRVNIDQEVAA